MTVPYGLPSPALGIWALRLQPASWRGLPFALKQSGVKVGRRVVVHEYPYRDDPWVEDLGRATRTITISGFLIGDDVFQQRDAMVAACNQAGAGIFTHPSLGALRGVVISPSFVERADLGRVVEFEFSFVLTVSDTPLSPTASDQTQDGALIAAANTDIAASGDYGNAVRAPLTLGEDVAVGVIGVVYGFAATIVGTARAVIMAGNLLLQPATSLIASTAPFGSLVAGLLNDATIVVGAVLGLVPPRGYYYGRYSSTGLTTMLPTTATVDSRLSDGVVTSQACEAAVAAALSVANQTPLSLPAAVQGAVAALLQAIPSPADKLRLLAELAAFSVVPTPSTAPMGVAIAAVQLAIAALVRRTALASLARGVAGYQPTSYDDAVVVRESLTALLDAEIAEAAELSDVPSFQALRALRTAVVIDLITRGSLLPRLVTVTRPVPLPSLTIAHQLYLDATRSDDLIARVDPFHPLFMPLSFSALSY